MTGFGFRLDDRQTGSNPPQTKVGFAVLRTPAGARTMSSAARLLGSCEVPGCRRTAGARFRSSPLGRVLAVLVAAIVVLIVSAIVLPPEGSQVRSGEGSGEGPVSVSH